MDDGFKWRKYGKKSVKNSPSPRYIFYRILYIYFVRVSVHLFGSYLHISKRMCVCVLTIRNYYRCSTEGCSVKKRVERDPNDPSYVITTYDGTHNHASPDVVYYATQDSESGRFVVSGYHHITRSS